MSTAEQAVQRPARKWDGHRIRNAVALALPIATRIAGATPTPNDDAIVLILGAIVGSEALSLHLAEHLNATSS